MGVEMGSWQRGNKNSDASHASGAMRASGGRRRIRLYAAIAAAAVFADGGLAFCPLPPATGAVVPGARGRLSSSPPPPHQTVPFPTVRSPPCGALHPPPTTTIVIAAHPPEATDAESNPRAAFTAVDVVTTCLDAMLENDAPYPNAGLETCFDFSSDRCRASLGGSLEAFVEYASNPTFGSMIDADRYVVARIGDVIAEGKNRGAMQTVLVRVTPKEGAEDRHFLWTLQKERRPPRRGLWLVHECIFAERAYALTL